jgi:cell division protein ZapA (FtsZ GTPase activity inhibitor)
MDMNEAKRIEVLLYGDSYSVISDEPAEKVLEVAKQVDELMRLIARRTGLSDVKKIAVLTALKLATSQRKLEEDTLSYKQLCEQLIQTVDQNL